MEIFSEEWIWLLFVVIGMILVMLELFVGIDTGLDMVFIGSAFILGGLISWPLNNWIFTVIITCVICIAYIALGRRYVHRWTNVKKTRTNVDALIGQKGIVIQGVTPSRDGRVKVRNEEWKAGSDEVIQEGEEIEVTGINGVTLKVEKTKGGK
ncbi:MAG: NfeD family protein [Dehalococcoidales bacterium]|nr:NfeD family protein [Dehalococcoidales bacterium]